jgi:Putative adhesin
MSARTSGPRRHRAVRTLLAACAAVTAVALAGGCSARAADDADPEHRAFTLHGNTLTIDSDDSSLELVPVDGDQVRVTRWFSGKTFLGGDPKASWSWRDDRLTLRVRCSGVVSDCAAKHRVEIPRGVAVTVREQDGKVTASGFAAALSVRSDDGSVQVDNCSGTLDLRAEDGSVRAADVSSRRVKVTTDDGSARIELSRVPDRVETRSEDGSTEIVLPRSGGSSPVAYRVDAAADDGRLDVDVPRDTHSPHVITARTEDGRLTVRSAN